jgi:LEA14-like dessication related protein
MIPGGSSGLELCTADPVGRPCSSPGGRRKLPLLPLLLALLLSSCLGYKEVVLQDVWNIEVRTLNAKGLELRVEAVIENPNGYRIRAMDPDVDLYLNGKLVGKGKLDSTLVLERRSTATYSIPLRAELSGGSLMMVLLSGALSGNLELTAKGTVVGKAGLIRKRFPFELTETLDL